MTDKELVERLREKADLCLAYDLTAAADAIERLQNEAEGMRSNWSKSVITIKRLKSELTQEKNRKHESHRRTCHGGRRARPIQGGAREPAAVNQRRPHPGNER